MKGVMSLYNYVRAIRAKSHTCPLKLCGRWPKSNQHRYPDASPDNVVSWPGTRYVSYTEHYRDCISDSTAISVMDD